MKQCSSHNMIFVECISSCPRTCQNPSSTIGHCSTQINECISGCVCSNETVYDKYQKKCVKIDQCTCQYNNIYYQPGKQISVDCNDW